MAEKNESRDTPYNGERSTEPHQETGNINSRNNNVEASAGAAIDPDVEGANTPGIGDAAVNDQKLSSFTSNHSADA